MGDVIQAATSGTSLLTDSPWSTGAIFALLVAAISWLYRARDRDRDQEVARLEKQIDRLQSEVDRLRGAKPRSTRWTNNQEDQ